VLVPAPGSAEWGVAGYLGGTRIAPSALSIHQPAAGTDLVVRPVAYGSRSFESPLYYGVRVTYAIPRTAFGVEVEFVHAKVHADTERLASVVGRRNDLPVDVVEPIARSVQAFSISHGLNLLLVNLVARVPLGSPRGPLAIVVRAGAGPTIPHAESTIGEARREQYELGSMAVGAGGGIELRLGRGLSALAEYRFTRTRQTVTIAAGEAGALLQMHHGIFGAAYRF
jgi:hypothetical protein